MKNRKSALLIIISIISLVVAGCNHMVNTKQKAEVPEGKVLLSIRLNAAYSRTAVPLINWNEFTYELIAMQNPGEATQKAPVTLFDSREENELVVGVTLDPARYKFTLNAYKNGKKVLTGEELADLTAGNTSLSFKMYAVSGSTGNASVKIRYPKNGPVSKIVAYVSNQIFEEKSGIELESKMVSGKYEVVYNPTNLPSNTEQYANIRFYDSNNTLVYSCAESLIIVGGCTSQSEIELTDEDWHTYLCTVTLKKDGSGWISSNKTVSLVNKTASEKVYELADSAGGKFKASVAEGVYYVYVNGENTGIEFNSANKNIDVDYYTVSMTPVKNSTMVPVSGGIEMEDNIAVVQAGKDITYQVKLSQGYEAVSGLVLKENGQTVSGADFNKNQVISPVNETVVIKAEGITPIVYTITYSDNGTDFAAAADTKLAYWYKYQDTYTPPQTFTAEETVTLPAIENIRKKNSFFDAWSDEEGNTVIDTAGVYKNLVLNANWKSAPYADDANKIIYANGFNLLIKGSDTKNTLTYIYVDYNGDGIKNNDDYQITCTNISTGKNNDFSGYELRAGSSDGSYVPKSDFIFTMTGGKISAIYGLNSRTKKYSNKSTLKISGTAQIGSIEGKTTVTNADSTTTTTAAAIKGIMLDTLSSERVFIVDQMSNLTDTSKTPYSVTCVTSYRYDRNNEHVVAEITNSNYASLANFTCWSLPQEEETAYKQIILSHREEFVNSILRTYIRMADDSGIILPTEEEIVWDEVKQEFTFGTEIINKNCSVFSLAIENGTFRVNERTTITNNTTDSEQKIENTLTYMAQPTPSTYVEELNFNESYVYMQVFSAGDLLTPLVINDFLTQLRFSKLDAEQKIKVTLNIETVPSSFIKGNGDGHDGSEFKYFNGSFYKRIQYDNDPDSKKTGFIKQTVNGKDQYLINWTNSYNKAKSSPAFNGLTGYLMNITSEVENNYIFDTFYKLYPDQLSFAGGAAYVPIATMQDPESGLTINKFDQPKTANSTKTEIEGSRNNASKWYWQSGPEAGMCFWNTAVGNDDASAAAGKIEGVFERWNNSTYLHGDLYDKDINSTDPTKMIKGRASSEPNGPSKVTINGITINSTSEPCLQFLAGKLTPSNGDSYYANGFWNNLSDSTPTSGYGCTGFIVEYTPYATKYGTQVANYQAIKRSAEY